MDLSIAFIAVTVIVGSIMGLLGGGGTILLVPLLTYLGHLDPKEAIPTSLVVVTFSAVVSTILYARKGRVEWTKGLTLAAFAMGTSYLGGHLAKLLPSIALMILFAILMIASSLIMFFRKREEVQVVEKTKKKVEWKEIAKTGALGLCIGLITGLVGAGGGFIIVPVLVIVMHLDMKHAVATSLMVIALNSTAALVAHLSTIKLNWSHTGIIAAAMLAGTVVGTLLSSKIDSSKLKKAFAVMVFVIAITILVVEVPKLF